MSDLPFDEAKPIDSAAPTWSVRGLIAIVASVGVVALIYSIVGPLLAVNLERRGVSSVINGALAAMPSIAVLLCGVAIPWVVRRFGAVACICFGTGLAVVALLVVAAAALTVRQNRSVHRVLGVQRRRLRTVLRIAERLEAAQSAATRDDSALIAARRQLQDRNDRKKHGLPELPRMPKIDDRAQWNNSYLTSNADWVDFETTVSTSAGQIALAPGYLQRAWTQGGRRYYHYKSEAKLVPFFSWLSAVCRNGVTSFHGNQTRTSTMSPGPPVLKISLLLSNVPL